MKEIRIRKHCVAAAAALVLATGQGFAAEPAGNATVDQIKKVMDDYGLQFWGYGRGGFYSAPKGQPKGNYSLGGDLQKFRLGNEGDNYLEVGFGKKFDLGNGVKWGTYYMPTVYNGSSGTAQLYTDLTGLDFAPGVTLWAGQRYHRIQDIHIVDNWLMQDGDNYGAGVDGIAIGAAKLNVALHTEGSSGNKNANLNNGRRINLQLRDIPVNPGGKLSLTMGVIQGDFALGKDGTAIGLLHNQSDFMVAGLTNALFVQASNGHASLSGQFYNLDSGGLAQSGAKQTRIAEVLNWQSGRFGGQALVGYQTLTPDGGLKTKDFSLGGRFSYGLGQNTKLLFEPGTTSRKVEGTGLTQRLNKVTAAVAFGPGTDFWNRPEFRVYVTRASWNAAAAAANSTSFGQGGRRGSTTVGAQVEAWW